MNFRNKVVLITGAASGIGAAIAVHFARLGGRLVLTDMNEQKLGDTVLKCDQQCDKAPTKPVSFTVNLTKEQEVQCLVSDALEVCQQVDVLVNAAGILENGTIETTSLQQFDRVIETNMRAMYQLTMLTVPSLIKTKGSIVNVSCVGGIRSFPNLLAYNVSKSAVDQFTRCVALELGNKGVRCNSVNPGVIITNLHKAAGMSDDEYKAFIRRAEMAHALCRTGEADEVANAVTFLASYQASYITGVNLFVDGGKHLICPS